MKRGSRSTIALLAPSPPAVQSRPLRRRDPRQPDLPFDPMPARIEPCLALLRPTAPSAGDWLFEIKWDGYRLAIHIEPTSVRVITRGGHDWTHRFPAIAAAACALNVHTAILDGEAVCSRCHGAIGFRRAAEVARGTWRQESLDRVGLHGIRSALSRWA